MAEKTAENQEEKENSENQEEEETSQKNEEEKTSEENQEGSENKESLESLAAQKRHQREKREEAESKVEELQNQLNELKDADTEKEKDEAQENSQFTNEERDFLLLNRNVDAETFDVVRRLAKAYEVPLSEAYKNDEVKDFINFRKEREDNEKKVPGPSSPSARTKPDYDLSTKEGRMKFAEEEAQRLKGRSGSVNV